MRDDLRGKGRGNVGSEMDGSVCRSGHFQILICEEPEMHVVEQSTTHLLSSPMNMLFLSSYNSQKVTREEDIALVNCDG